MKIDRLFSLILVAALVSTTTVSWSQATSKAKKPTKTQTAKTKLKNVNAQKTAMKKNINAVKVERAEVREELAWVNNKIRRINDKINTTEEKIRSRKAEQRRAAEDLAFASKQQAQTRSRVRSRITSMYRQGEDPAIMVLISSQDAATFASRKALLERIANRDRSLFEEMKERRIQVAQRKKVVDRLVKEVLALEDELRDEQAGLIQAQEDKVDIIKGLNTKESLLEKQLDELEAESNRLIGEIESYQAASRQGSASYVIPWRGGLVRPARGRFSSPFGYRIHPISRRRKLHTGLDIAAPTGTPIYAAAPGVVISAGWRGGYGNAVIIDHGGGFSTLYGHCSRLLVRSGQRVKAGQNIALMGSTGHSTGPHLHFETRVNGRPVNPLSRL